MKRLFILLTVIWLATYAGALCPSGCACFDDSVCSYYCYNSQCQYYKLIGNLCSGYYVHPRECGSSAYCEPSTWTCQRQKSNGAYCTYDYSCLSGYCDYTRRACGYKYTIQWQVTILVPVLIVFVVFTLIIVLVIARRRRQRAFMYYQNRSVVLPPATPYSYQNPCAVGEMPPPAYPGATYAPPPTSYQNYQNFQGYRG